MVLLIFQRSLGGRLEPLREGRAIKRGSTGGMGRDVRGRRRAGGKSMYKSQVRP